MSDEFPVWTTSKGERIPLNKMRMGHLENALESVHRRCKVAGTWAADTEVGKWWGLLQDELDRRAGLEEGSPEIDGENPGRVAIRLGRPSKRWAEKVVEVFKKNMSSDAGITAYRIRPYDAAECSN